MAGKQSSALSSNHDDPLADAHCPHCGYSLRGLPENRCPECGAAFDPADFVGTFLPLWPRLLTWYLIVHVVRSLFDLPWMMRILSSWAAPVGSSVRFISTAIGIAQILNMATVLTLGLVATWGLHRRKDWSRKACIAIFAVDCLEAVVRLWPSIKGLATIGNATEAANTLLTAAAGISACVLPLLLCTFLMTGLRPHSLIRSPSARPPLLKMSLFQPRHDWFLLTVLVLAGLGITQACWGASWLSRSLPLILGIAKTTFGGTMGRWDSVLACGYFIAQIATGICAIAAAVRGWRRPATLRPMLTAVTVLSVHPLIWAVLTFAVNPSLLRSGMHEGALNCVASLMANCVGPLLVPLVLLLFAFLVIKREDIDRLARDAKRTTR